MRIAVCLSGQPRTIEYTAENIKRYFQDYEVDYFCHSWNYNTYKRKKENPLKGEQPVYWEKDQVEDYNKIHLAISRLKPKKLVIETKDALPLKMAWSSLFYSCMMANHYKKMYEYQNNFRYDLVFRARFDTIFNPDTKFIPHPNFDKNNYLDVFGIIRERMSYEFERINVSDHIFYGSSTAMDVVCDAYKYIYRESLRMDDYSPLGPGTYLTEVCNKFNLYFEKININLLQESVYRKEMIPLDPVTEYEKIKNFNSSFYIVKND